MLSVLNELRWHNMRDHRAFLYVDFGKSYLKWLAFMPIHYVCTYESESKDCVVISNSMLSVY